MSERDERVQAVLDDYRRHLSEAHRENDRLRARVAELEGRRTMSRADRLIAWLDCPIQLYQDEHVLTVEGPVSNYIIEPARFELGLNRVEMVDHHLADLTRSGRPKAPDCYGNSDYDVLLEARQYFTEESDR